MAPFKSNEFLLHDSFLFSDEVFSFCPDHLTVSLDVESLFTNIHFNEAINISIDDLFCHTNTIYNLDCNDMREILILAAYQSFFTFDQVMYRHIDGVAMGSHLSPRKCIFMSFWKTVALRIPPDISPKDFKGYVDDIL